MTTAGLHKAEPWRRRLYIPNYRVGEAARYARLSRQTVAAWHRYDTRPALSPKEPRVALSYLQLIEVAVVAAMRHSGISLSEIRNTRDYAAKSWKSEYPFAVYKFKTDGKSLFVDLSDVEDRNASGTLVRTGRGGQLAWQEIIGRLEEFEYERDGFVIRWFVAGSSSEIVIDPRVAFGSPHICGVPTWIIKSRFQGGETLEEISEDFDLDKVRVQEALSFEGVNTITSKTWTH